MKIDVTLLFVLIPAGILAGLIWGTTLIRLDVERGEEIFVRGSVYKCEQIEMGY